MFYTVDASNGVPIYSQIIRQTKFAIASRTLRSGQLLPSVRDLATQLAVNPNTVAKAFRDLQTEGVVEALRGRGMVVCGGALDLCRRQRQQLLAERIESVMTEALQSGLKPDEIRSIVDRQLRILPPTIQPLPNV